MFDEFVNFDIAKKLKDKGFKEPCFAYYTPSGSSLIFNKTPFRSCIVEDCLYSVNSLPIGCIGADFIDSPTISKVLRWFREVKRIDAGAVWNNLDGKWVGYINKMDIPDLVGEYVLPNTYDAYEQAAIASIEYVLNNLI